MKYILSIIIGLSALLAAAQDTFEAGLLPSVNLNGKLKDDWKLNLKIESRQILREGIFGADQLGDYSYELTDFALVTSKKIGLNNALAGGVLMRFRGEDFIQRTIQQFTFVRRYSSFRMAHRFSSDQTFSKSESPEFRFRYRITAEIPLNGTSVDFKEFYFKINHEYLNAFQSESYDLEIRMVPLLGYQVNAQQKVEGGLDYRINRLFVDNQRHRFWLSLNWYVSF